LLSREELAGSVPLDAEFDRLCELGDLGDLAEGRRHGWKFDRDEIHERA
jgi:hypothetical protein